MFRRSVAIRSSGKSSIWPLLLVAIVPVASVFGALYYTQVQKPQSENLQMNQTLVENVLGLANPVTNKLDARFTDANGDLVADSPAEKDQIDPKTLVFSYVAEDPEKFKAVFAEFTKHLHKVTGKEVEYFVLPKREGEDAADGTDELLRALREGRLHVAGLGTGAVPLAVDACGFVPAYKLADDSGVGAVKMNLIVPAASPARSIGDLKKPTIALTEYNSNSGYKAAIRELKKQGLLPVRDYNIVTTGGHQASIEGIVAGRYEVAAVASDVLARAVAGKVEGASPVATSQYRVIFESESFPTAGFGYAHNLKPALADKIKEAFRTFDWKGTGLEKQFGAEGRTKFVPVNYKDDWALVRAIDDQMGVKHEIK